MSLRDWQNVPHNGEKEEKHYTEHDILVCATVLARRGQTAYIRGLHAKKSGKREEPDMEIATASVQKNDTVKVGLNSLTMPVKAEHTYIIELTRVTGSAATVTVNTIRIDD